MKKNKMMMLAALVAAFALCLGMTGCGQQAAMEPVAPAASAVSAFEEGGCVLLKVNPEIDIRYDDNGIVTAVEGRNDDGKEIVASVDGYIGKECRQVVSQLVEAIGDAGYFVEELEGKSKTINIEVEPGSKLPSDTFVQDIVAEVQAYVKDADIHSPIKWEAGSDYGETDFDETDYDDSDYADGESDLDEAESDLDEPDTDYNEADTDFDEPESDYDQPDSDYDEAESDFDEPESDYDESDYDDSDYDAKA